jgi:hypothetical protein
LVEVLLASVLKLTSICYLLQLCIQVMDVRISIACNAFVFAVNLSSSTVVCLSFSAGRCWSSSNAEPCIK